MAIVPIGERVLIRPREAEEVTKSGIVIAATAEKEKKARGKIVAVGTGEEIAKLGLKVGDEVVFGKYSGDEVEVDDNGTKVEYKVLYVGHEKDESDVLAIIE